MLTSDLRFINQLEFEDTLGIELMVRIVLLATLACIGQLPTTFAQAQPMTDINQKIQALLQAGLTKIDAPGLRDEDDFTNRDFRRHQLARNSFAAGLVFLALAIVAGAGQVLDCRHALAGDNVIHL